MFTLNYMEPVLLPTYLKSSAIIPVPAQKPAKENSLLVYPNPAKSYFIVKYELDNKYAEVSIVITDMTGKNTKNYLIDLMRDYLVIPTSGLAPGNYVVKLVVDGSESGVQKIVIH